MRAVHTAIPLRGHPLHEHYLRMVAAVVMHDGQQRNLVMRCRPQHAGRVVHIAIGLNVDGQPSIFPVCKRSTHGSRRVVADAAATLASDVVVVLIHVPQAAWPTANETLPSDERPIFILDQRP